ncbi:MAG: (d)CMP kinase [Puniceicoccales bacterium]|jgi:cytidylate kinase|nr:(d)CMP kinase [Puniceicoccales bacterium]
MNCEQQLQHLSDHFRIIAIDGAAGSGKTSTAQMLSSRLRYAFVSTGDHYRTLAHHLSLCSIDPKEDVAIEHELHSIHITVHMEGRRERMCLNGAIFGEKELHNERINGIVADYARNLRLRAFLHRYQRQLPAIFLQSSLEGMVVEGRDVTSVVFPSASLRIFLCADLRNRVQRRRMEGIEDNIDERDRKDAVQLQKTDGIYVIDSTHMTLENVVEHILTNLK